MTFFIADDDPGSRRMLAAIIKEEELGECLGEAADGKNAEERILALNPDLVLIDLLMPVQDGIETVQNLRNAGYEGSFVMISQIENKEMVAEAYRQGIEFFIHKPINRMEVVTVLKKVRDGIRMKRSLLTIQRSLSDLVGGIAGAERSRRTVAQVVQTILGELGMAGETGSRDIVWLMEHLITNKAGKYGERFPAVKDLYEALARETAQTPGEIQREMKAIEQRVRRAIAHGLEHMASLGLTDFAHPTFESYAPRFFDFADIRLKMNELVSGEKDGKIRLNVKKFLQMLYLETLERLR